MKKSLYVLFCILGLWACKDKKQSSEVLDYTSKKEASATSLNLAQFPRDKFFFGLATAPAHVEEGLNDGWIDFARQGKVAAFKNYPYPEERLRFWSDYAREIDLAAQTGVQVFRMGVDWGRLVPNKPNIATCKTSGGVQDKDALKHYQKIVEYVRSKNMKVMMTLFHHSPPKWFMEAGGWPVENLRDCFIKFSKDVVDSLGNQVDYWVTFNEPAVYNMFAYVAGIWPPGKSFTNPVDLIVVPGIFKGAFVAANENMAYTHHEIYKYIKKEKQYKSLVGIAHNVGWHKAATALDVPSVLFSVRMMNELFMDLVASSMDYIGLNYYGAEYMRGAGVGLEDGVEYSDSGRAVDPYGFYALLKAFHERYNVAFVNRKDRTQLPVIVTENGISDASDILRPAYIVEHLLALEQARKEGVNVIGYIFWTISDNWEWADGYCPKFGLYAVDRAKNFERIPRKASLDLFTEIVRTGQLTARMREQAWQRVVDAQNKGTLRDMCRAADGKSSLDEPAKRPVVKKDWRFDLNNPSKRFENVQFLNLQPSLDAFNLGKEFSWFQNSSYNTILKNVLNIFQAFKNSKLSLNLASEGKLRVGIHSEPNKRIVCNLDGQPVPLKIVFEDNVYFSASLNSLDSVDVENIRLFVGPTSVKNYDFSNFSFRARINKIYVKDKKLWLDSGDMPLLRWFQVDLQDTKSPMPKLTCVTTDLSKFGEGLQPR